MIEDRGCRVLILNTGILKPYKNDSLDIISPDEMAREGCGLSVEEMKAQSNKGECIACMAKGAALIAKALYEKETLTE